MLGAAGDVPPASTDPNAAPVAPSAEGDLGYIPASGANQSIEARINAGRAIHQLPETDGLTEPERAELYSRMFLDSTSADGRAAYQSGDRVIFGMRVETGVNANSGRGLFDDRVVVLSLREDGSPTLHYEGAFNTESAGSYQEAGPYFGVGQGNPHPEGVDANSDGLRDLGRLPEGTYAYAWDHSPGRGPNVQGNYNVLRPVDPIDVERDVNRDGWFDAQDAAAVTNPNALDSGRSVLFHRGYPNFTGSGGCQTFPNNQFAGFAAALPASPQAWYPYTLTRM